MNNDLISRSALKEEIKERTYQFEQIPIRVDKVISIIDNAPTVEPERPQAEWIKIGSLGNGNAQYECSNCYHNDEQAESQEVPYCWHCGAKMMKEGVKNDT